jgi:acetylornithine deacetylase
MPGGLADSVRQEAVAGLRELVRIPSVTGEEEPAQRWIAKRMETAGLAVDRWCPRLAELESHRAFSNIAGRDTAGRPNVVGLRRGTGGGRSVILNGHVDVVAPGAREAWTHDPWSGAVVDGRLYGRGACDMKAGLLAGLYAVKALRHAGVRLKGDVIVESVIGEEEGGVGSLATLLRGYRADAAVVLEPTRLAVSPSAAGVALFRLTVRGRTAHASQRSRGISALEKFIALHAALGALERELCAEVDDSLYQHVEAPLSLNLHHVEAGSRTESTVPGQLVASGRFGYLGMSAEAARRRFEAKLAEVAASDQWLAEHPPEVEWTSGLWDPVPAPPAPIVDTLARACETATGAAPVVVGKLAGTDARILTNGGGIPSVVFGPGDNALAHFPDEHVELAEYVQAIEVLTRFLPAWCGVTE